MYKYDPCECCGHDLNGEENPERIERMARFIAAEQHSHFDLWDESPGKDGYEDWEKVSYLEKAKRFLSIADGKTLDELYEEEE